MGTEEELEKQLQSDHRAVLGKIMEANRDLVDRITDRGLTFDLDAESDMLTILIGTAFGPRPDTYTQAAGDIYLDLELTTDRIAGMTIMQFEEVYLKTRDGRKLFKDLTPILKEYGSVTITPTREQAAASDISGLVPALA